MSDTDTSGTEQHVLLPLVKYEFGKTEYCCQKCGKTGLGGIRGPCKGVPSTGAGQTGGDDSE